MIFNIHVVRPPFGRSGSTSASFWDAWESVHDINVVRPSPLNPSCYKFVAEPMQGAFLCLEILQSEWARTHEALIQAGGKSLAHMLYNLVLRHQSSCLKAIKLMKRTRQSRRKELWPKDIAAARDTLERALSSE